jgi:hypothetical protein
MNGLGFEVRGLMFDVVVDDNQSPQPQTSNVKHFF